MTTALSAPADIVPADDVRIDRQISIALFGGLFAIYLAVMRGQIEVYDTQAMLAVAQNLVNHGSLKAEGAGYALSTPWSPYGIAISVLAVPLYALSKWVGHYALLVSLIAPAFTAACAVVIYRISRAMRWGSVYGLFAALSFGLFSMAVWYSTQLFSEPAVTLCLLVIILQMIRWQHGSHRAVLWIGIAAACALQLRSDSLFTIWIGLAAIPFFVPKAAFLSKRSLLSLGIPMLVSVAILVWYNEVRYDRAFIGSYGPGGGFSTPVLHGLGGLLFSPGKGLFIFNPLAIMGFAGLVVMFIGPQRERNRGLAVVCLLFIVPRIVFYAKWGVWDGGSVWGPRFLLPSVGALAVTAVPLYQTAVPSRVAVVCLRAATVLLAAFAAVINFLSIRVPLGEWIGVLSSPEWRQELGIHGINSGADVTTALDFHFIGTPIWGFVILLRRGVALTNAHWWATGHAWVGWLGLALGFGCLLAAAGLARDQDRDPEIEPFAYEAAEVEPAVS